LTAPAWTCPDCGAPFANRNASHSCVRVDLDRHFDKARPGVRAAFDRLVELASVDGPIPVVAQKSRIVFASPMSSSRSRSLGIASGVTSCTTVPSRIRS
jgi:hypothetical protein